LTDYASTQNVGTLKDFLGKIPSLGVPDKLTVEKLASYGYTSNNDRPIIGVLKFIGFLDSTGAPTDKYAGFRNTNKQKAVMASCLRTAYSELFSTFPDADRKDVEALTNFFRANTKTGDATLRNIVGTFRTLCEFADFQQSAEIVWDTKEGIEPPMPKARTTYAGTSPSEGQGLVVNLNIQLQLPVTEDATIYDKIFQSLRKNLFER
jgi:hypothetical protein